MLADDVDAMTAAAAGHADDPEALAADVTALLLGWLRRPEVVRTQGELVLEANRRPELMEVFDRWRQGLDRVVEGLLECSGLPDPAVRAAVGVAALEGVLATAARMPRLRRGSRAPRRPGAARDRLSATRSAPAVRARGADAPYHGRPWT
jgi:hypothetical protein